jgi:predicted secreted protein
MPTRARERGAVGASSCAAIASTIGVEAEAGLEARRERVVVELNSGFASAESAIAPSSRSAVSGAVPVGEESGAVASDLNNSAGNRTK